MIELKGFVIWEILYTDGNKERFKAYTQDNNKALQIAQYKALNGRNVKSVRRIVF